jgi:hypothetical protein
MDLHVMSAGKCCDLLWSYVLFEIQQTKSTLCLIACISVGVSVVPSLLRKNKNGCINSAFERRLSSCFTGNVALQQDWKLQSAL